MNAVSIVIDSILAFPNIVAAMAILFFLGGNFVNLLFVVAFFTIPVFTRISRANTMVFAQREFVMAARAQGASSSGDRVELSPEARQIAGLAEAADRLPDVRQEKVQLLRREIAAGTYQVDAKTVARAILEFEDGFRL